MDQKPRKHNPPEYVHRDEREWETIRWPGQTGKMLFHPSPDRPTEPNAGIVRYEPGSYHPQHEHDFAQVWYVLEGEFRIGGRVYGPGTMMYHQDPHFEQDLFTATGGRPIYDGRFNMRARRPVDEEQTDI